MTVDGRFREMFEGEEFVAPVKVDKYGRKVDSERDKKDLRRFYRLEEEGKDKEDDTDVDHEEEPADVKNSSSTESDSGSGSDTTTDGEYIMDESLSTHPLVDQRIPTGSPTRRLALVNMDWDQIRADDIFTLLNGFKPPMGGIRSVIIYPSAFGRERMRRELVEGPPRELFEGENLEANAEGESVSTSSGSDTESAPSNPHTHLREEDEDYDSVALRKYQLERLRYYYAVIECDSEETAAHIYRQCDGSEFEKSANFLDLRYIPDHVTFGEEDGIPKDVCTELPKNYRAKPDMITPALQLSKVSLTWDADDTERVRATRRFNIDTEEADLRAYLASSSSSEGEEDVEGRDEGRDEGEMIKYRQLLLNGDDANVFGRKDPSGEGDELRVTFASALRAGGEDKEMSFTVEEEESPKGGSSKSDMTPFDKYMARRKAKKDARKEESNKPRPKETTTRKKRNPDNNLELLVDEGHRELDIDLHDERFSAVFEQPEFALDPANPAFKRTKGMEKIIKERQRRRTHK